MFIGFNVAFFPMHLAGMAGMPRRIYTYPAGLGWEGFNMTSTIGAFVLSAGILISIVNFFVSMRSGALAGANPWGADSLEWSIPSPPKDYAFIHIPTVASRHPLWDDYDELADPDNDRLLLKERVTMSTTALDAIPESLSKMPNDTAMPLLLALALTVAFTGFVLQLLWLAGIGLLLSLASMAGWLWPEEPMVIS